MLAVIEVGGNQFIVRENEEIDVKRLDVEVGKTLTLEAMLLSDEDGSSVKIGTPIVEGSKITLEVISHYKAEKVRVFKMKSKKRYTRNKGFRASMTKVVVKSIA